MMERLGNWGLRLVECFIPFLFVLIHSASAQQDFVSLACCAGSNYTDSSTNISWISDFNWFPDEKSCKNISTNTNTSTSTNIPISYINPSTERSRVFNISSGKKCYNLKINKEKEYLIRGTFLLGESSRSSFTRDYFFNVYVGVTQLSIVKYSQNPVWVEGIFITERNYIDFCLGKGNVQDPYISELELRPLHDLDYVQGFSSNVVLKLVTRVNVGNASSDTIRFPDDPSDRKWIPPPNPYPGAISISTLTIKITNYSGVLSAPQKVLQTALTHSNALVFLHNDLDKEPYDYRIIFYFLELDDTVISGQRLIDIYINGRKEEDSFNILANGSNFRPISFDVKAQESFNLTLVASDGSDLGPICNAYEILQVRPWVQETDQNDVEVILKVKDELLVSNKENDVLRTWSGDPCLPLPWEGLGCESINGSSLITKLDLSERKFEGLIPGNVTELANLKILNLGLNHFAGRIPPFPSSSMLISVDLSYNDLTELPESLASLPHLKILNIRGNPQLCKDLPPSSNNSGVSIEYEKCDAPGPTYLRGIVIGTVACGSFLLTIMVGVIYVCFCRHRFSPRGRSYEKEGLKMKLPKIDDVTIKSICVESFALKDIEVATDNYKTLIGEGGFGSVYRGTLTDGQDVAVKVRSATSTQGTREFDNEVNLLSTIRHENLVPLLGHCRENDQEILVYPFMSNGSLQDRLYGELSSRKTLDWATRLSIALGAARGLTYLHTYGGRCVIHRDVKSSNILLDDSMCAKVADFGFSKYAPQEGDSGASLEVRGTAGYLDPEYYSTHHLSAKSDVFSFGVVLLEIVSGREPLNIKRPRNEWSLVELAKQYLRESKIDDLVDPTIKGGYHAEAMWRVVEVALACIEPLSAFRPCMADIVRELEDSLIIENNASEYMRSIDSLGTSNHFSMAMDKKMALVATTPTPTEPSPLSHDLPHPEPR